jgi:hypothetical protein
VMPCAGGEGFLVMTTERAQSLRLPHARLAATIERHNAFPDDPIQVRGDGHSTADRCTSRRGSVPRRSTSLSSMTTTVITAMQLEDLGFCDKGAAPRDP